jgi:hypothetical protein
MKKMLVVLFFIFSLPACAQVQQSGTVTPGHATRWVSPGVIGDAGTAASGLLTSLGVTNNGGQGICVNSAPITAPYNQICLSASTTGPGRLTLQNYGGASPQQLQFFANGSQINSLAGYGITDNILLYSAQALTSAQQTQARANIGASTSPALPSNSCKNITDYGASTGSSDNSTAIRNAYLAAGAAGIGCVFIPDGTWIVGAMTFTEYNNMTFICNSASSLAAGGTKLQALAQTTTMFTISSLGRINFQNCTWVNAAGGAQTSGSYVVYNVANSSFMTNVAMYGGWRPLSLISTGGMRFTNIDIRNWGENGIYLTGGQDQYFSNLIMDFDTAFVSTASPNACIYSPQNGGSLTIVNSDLLHCHNGIWFDPGNSQFVSWAFLSNVYIDSCDDPTNSNYGTGAGLKITPKNGGLVQGIQITNFWTSTCGNGAYIVGDSAAGTNPVTNVDGISAVNWQIFNNQKTGLVTDYSSNISIVNPTMAGNGSSSVGSYYDILLKSNNKSFSLVSGTLGYPQQSFPQREAYCIGVDTNYAGTLKIDAVTVKGCINGPIAFGTNVVFGAGSSIERNPGINPLGMSTVTVGASPFSYTAGYSHETLIISGGTNLVAGVGGIQVLNSTSACVLGTCSISLDPLQVVQITYTVAPTIVKNAQ